jgi:glycosyltransferase involved in cell wall biosynthesis
VHLRAGTSWFRIVNPVSAFINWQMEDQIVTHARHTLIHSTTEETRQHFHQKTRVPISVVVNFVNEQEIYDTFRRVDTRAVRTKYNVRGKFLLYCGSLTRLKNVEGIIRNVRKTCDEYDDEITLGVIGSGPREQAIQQLASKSEDSRCHIVLLGTMDNRHKLELMASCDALVLLSQSEQLPLVVLEALAFDRQVIATAVGGIPDIAAAGVSTRITLLRDENEFPHAAHQVKKGIRTRLNRPLLTKYNVSRVAQEFLALYRRVRNISSRRATSRGRRRPRAL